MKTTIPSLNQSSQNKNISRIPILLVLLILGTLSCTSVEIAELPQPGESEYPLSYCVYPGMEQCFQGTSCPGGGVAVPECPYKGGTQGNPSGSANGSSSSGTNNPSGSSPSATLYAYCVFSSDRACLQGPSNVCPPGGELNNNCPYNSNRSSSSGSKSTLPLVLENGYFTDPRDGNKYKYEIAPDGSVWMSENLKYSKNGTVGYCYGVDINGENPHQNSTTCDNGYGRIYEWSVAMDDNNPQGLCPNGWHVPSQEEWSSITDNPIFCGTIKMSNSFCISAGNYNTNPQYLPLGWKERDYSGFYWTSSGYYFAGLWHCSPTSNPTSNGCMDIQTIDDTYGSYFSLRCVANEKATPPTPSSSSMAVLVTPGSSSVFVQSSSSSTSVVYSDKGNNISSYRTVQIGTQRWMAENLDYNVSGSKCYSNDPANCARYGQLYDWATAMTVCPAGWHVPTQAEWNTLSSYIESEKGCSSCDAKHLKAADNNGLDSYGFAALPGGDGRSDGLFNDVGSGGFWWSASEHTANDAYGRYITYYSDIASWNNYDKTRLFSVRCLQD